MGSSFESVEDSSSRLRVSARYASTATSTVTLAFSGLAALISSGRGATDCDGRAAGAETLTDVNTDSGSGPKGGRPFTRASSSLRRYSSASFHWRVPALLRKYSRLTCPPIHFGQLQRRNVRSAAYLQSLEWREKTESSTGPPTSAQIVLGSLKWVKTLGGNVQNTSKKPSGFWPSKLSRS